MSFSERLNLSEFAWTSLESRNRPMHVATLLIYAKPEDANGHYLSELVDSLRESTEFVDPFNKRFTAPSMLRPYPAWERDYDLDMEYHVRHLALPAPGGERELGALIARLHSNPLDFKRPLWEYHIIEGLEGNRFAIYFKMHHALVDGIAGVHMLTRSMSTDPEDKRAPALWSAEAPAVTNEADPSVSRIKRATKGAIRSLTSINNVSRSLLSVAQAARDESDPFSLPFQAPKSILNGRIGSQRRFATQAYAFSRIRRLSKIAGCTVNDIVLALSAGALRRFLRELNALPGQPMTAGVPVSLRPKDDRGAGSAVAFIIANLATHVADPLRRLEVIAKSTTRAKTLMSELSREEIENFSALMLTPQSLQTVLDLEGYTRPVFNVTVSNVPGPTETLYLRGSQLEAMFPVSAVTHGQALNITCYSYGGNISFGFAGCRDSVPHLQRIAVYTGEALEELEAVLLPKEETIDTQATAPTRIRQSKKRGTA
ncbi:MAG: WS/DGAT/MGAT family O-acyltransferase [Luminiphilus sp.]|jgi:diacylglycerol O-acyltransferase